MTDIINPLLEWLNTNPQWAGLVTFTISALESIAVIGTVVPGSITMMAIGILAGAGVIPLFETILWAILGAVVGDSISYWLGHYFKDRLREIWPFKDNPGYLEKGEIFVHKYGIMSVFIGRFIGPVRALVPLVAGMLGMKPLTFTLANISSAIGWAPAYMLPGILLGAASLELPPNIAVQFILVLCLFVLFILLCIWCLYKFFQLVHTQVDQIQGWLWHKIEKQPQFTPLTALLRHYDSRKNHIQLNLAFSFLLNSLAFILLALYVKSTGPSSLAINNIVYHLFRGIHTVSLDNFMINLTLFGQKEVVFPVFIVFTIWLVYLKRLRAAVHCLALWVLALASITFFKHSLKILRPWGIALISEPYSMPSGHTVLSTILFMGLTFLLVFSVKKKRWIFYTLGVTATLAVALSRLYLGAHWFTDILASWLLSAALLSLVMLSFQRQKENKFNPLAVLGVSLSTLALAFGLFHHFDFTLIQKLYKPLPFPTVITPMQHWWEGKNLPALTPLHTSLFGLPSDQINVEWAGSLSEIKTTLEAEGWNAPPVRDWISMIHRITDISSMEYLPLVSPQYLDNPPVLILVRPLNGKKHLLVISLWEAHRQFQGTGAALWVGRVAIVPRSYSWLFKKHRKEINMAPSLIFSASSKSMLWQWKIIQVSIPSPYSSGVTSQKIMLIREKHPSSS